MKYLGKTALLLAAVMALSGCGEESNAPEKKTENSTTTTAAVSADVQASEVQTTKADETTANVTTSAETKAADGINMKTYRLNKPYFPGFSDFRNGKVLINNRSGYAVTGQKSDLLIMEENGELAEFSVNTDKEVTPHGIISVGNNKYAIKNNNTGSQCFIVDDKGELITDEIDFSKSYLHLCNNYFVVMIEQDIRGSLIGAMDYDGNWISESVENAASEFLKDAEARNENFSYRSVYNFSGDRYILLTSDRSLVIYDFDTDKIIDEFSTETAGIADATVSDQSWSTENGIYIPVHYGEEDMTCILKVEPSAGTVSKMFSDASYRSINCFVNDETVSLVFSKGEERKGTVYDPDLNKICDIPGIKGIIDHVFETPDGFAWTHRDYTIFFDNEGNVTYTAVFDLEYSSKHSQYYLGSFISGVGSMFFCDFTTHNAVFQFSNR